MSILLTVIVVDEATVAKIRALPGVKEVHVEHDDSDDDGGDPEEDD